jgi:YfiH family protein
MEKIMDNLVYLDWPAPANVKACYTLRQNGHSDKPYDSFNLALHVDDEPEKVKLNRQLLVHEIQQENIYWLEQIHGTDVVNLDGETKTQADASVTRHKNKVCCVMTADCLPVFFCDQQGQQVAVAHAGWRGLCQGVLQNTVASFNNLDSVLAYLGPAISQNAFEVGEDVLQSFISRYPHLNITECFIRGNKADKWMADLYGLARLILNDCGVTAIFGGGECTFTQEEKYFSYRRDKQTGRMANLIWLE